MPWRGEIEKVEWKEARRMNKRPSFPFSSRRCRQAAGSLVYVYYSMHWKIVLARLDYLFHGWTLSGLVVHASYLNHQIKSSIHHGRKNSMRAWTEIRGPGVREYISRGRSLSDNSRLVWSLPLITYLITFWKGWKLASTNWEKLRWQWKWKHALQHLVA